MVVVTEEMLFIPRNPISDSRLHKVANLMIVMYT